MITLRPGSWAAAAVLLVAGASCSLTAAEPLTPPREGPPAAWSRVVPTGPNMTTLVGNVVVIANDRAVLGVDAKTGRELWRRRSTEEARVDVAGDLIVHRSHYSRTEPVRFTVIDPASGKPLWRGGPVEEPQVTRDAVIAERCEGEDRDCRITRWDLRTGKARWTIPEDEVWLADTMVGTRRPFAPSTDQVLARRPGGDRPLAWTGRKDFGQGGWYSMVVGRTFISTDHDPPSGDRDCTVTITAGEAKTGTVTWTRKVYSAREADGGCEKRLAPTNTRLDLIGAGSRIAASTADGRPQVFDLATGRTVWRGDVPGVPIDGDGHTLLVRERPEAGGLSLLDFETGRVLWRAPDPGLEGSSASWETAVTRKLVAVTGVDETDAVCVLVYDAASGRRLGQFPGWLMGLGDDWVAVATERLRRDEIDVGELAYDFIRM